MPSKAALLALESIQAEQAKELPQNEIDELIEKARSRVARMTDREESIINDETADEILRFDRRGMFSDLPLLLFYFSMIVSLSLGVFVNRTYFVVPCNLCIDTIHSHQQKN
jgi:hypothetical protein